MNAIAILSDDNATLEARDTDSFDVIWSTPNTHGAYRRLERLFGVANKLSVPRSGNFIVFRTWDEARAFNAANARGYRGAVLCAGENNHHHDSDFYAIVYDVELDAVIKIDDGTTRFACAEPCCHRRDITKENALKALAAFERTARANAPAILKASASRIRVGTPVVVARGRKVARGLTDTVKRLWDGPWGQRALIVANLWVDVKNLDAVVSEPTAEEIENFVARKNRENRIDLGLA